jgi:hypothetical protein
MLWFGDNGVRCKFVISSMAQSKKYSSISTDTYYFSFVFGASWARRTAILT